MSNTIEKKAFDVATSSVRHIGDYSKVALLERSKETRLNLSEIIKQLKDEKIDGFLDISIYERKKTKKGFSFFYLTGFKKDNKSLLKDELLINKINSLDSSKVLIDEVQINIKNQKLEVYQFTRPIEYSFKGKDILLGIVVLHYDKKAIDGIINKTILFSFLLTFIILLLVIAIVYFVGSRFTKPIITISDAANEITNGNLDINLDINSKDEIGQLAKSFDRMIKDLKEREKMGKYVSNSTIEMIKKDKASDLLLGGEFKKITFLFSDIRGFTALSETKQPDEIVDLVNFYLDLQSQIIESYDGDIDKFIGDEIMASFSGQDGFERALDCAIKIQNSIQEKNKEREKLGKIVCEVGIGINKGRVTLGNIGSRDRMDYTSIGSAVNLASKLCSQANESEILFPKKFAKYLNKEIAFMDMGTIDIKGISKAVEICSISIKGNK